MKIGIINYGMGNVQSLSNSLSFNMIESELVTDYNKVDKYDILILPGVGAFNKAMENLKKGNFIKPIELHVRNNKKIIGICLGMQLLFEKSYEFGEFNGLGLLKGEVLPFEDKINFRVPHVGWNNAKSLIKNFDNFSGDYYFVHSFYCKPRNTSEVIFQTNYGFKFCSGVNKNNIYGLQFHPEKSHNLGLNLLKKIIHE